MSHAYRVTETEDWLPTDSGLPRGRWALAASAPTLAAARKIQKFLGPRATVWKHAGEAWFEFLEACHPLGAPGDVRFVFGFDS